MALALARRTTDLSLRLVIQGEAERVPESHQCSLHGIRLGFLEGGFMGLAQIHVDAVTGAAALSDQRRPSPGRDGDANAGGVGDPPARLLVPAYGAFGLGNAADGDGLPLPAVKSKIRFASAMTCQPSRYATFPRPCSRWRTLARSRGAARAASCSGEKPGS